MRTIATDHIGVLSMRSPNTMDSGRPWTRVSRPSFFRFVVLLALVLSASLSTLSLRPVAAAEGSRFFPETGKTVNGKFLDYWESHGGLSIFGYPITDAQNEVDPISGKTYLAQWFERERFELHPENAGTPYEVLLG